MWLKILVSRYELLIKGTNYIITSALYSVGFIFSLYTVIGPKRSRFMGKEIKPLPKPPVAHACLWGSWVQYFGLHWVTEGRHLLEMHELCIVAANMILQGKRKCGCHFRKMKWMLLTVELLTSSFPPLLFIYLFLVCEEIYGQTSQDLLEGGNQEGLKPNNSHLCFWFISYHFISL